MRQAPGSPAATCWLVFCTLAYAAAAPISCIKEEVPEWFLPVRSDVSCARSILGAIPGEVSKRDVEVADELAGARNLTWHALQRSTFFQRDQHFGGRLWRSQFGNQFFFWMELAGGTALCSTLDQQSPKIFNENYCREEIRGAPGSPGCRAFLRNRNATGDNTAWHSWGAYAPAVAMIREEWMRAAYHVMKDTVNLDERPCLHIPALPTGASYLGVYFRCGDIATSYSSQYSFLDPQWLRRFLPSVSAAANVEYTVLFGNRGVHGSGASKSICEGYFAVLAQKLRNMTGTTVLVVPEGYDKNPHVGLVRDLRCMAQSVAFVDYSYASSIGYVASFLHNGCAAVVPHFAPGVKAGKTPASAFSRPANARTRLVEVLQGDLVKHIV